MTDLVTIPNDPGGAGKLAPSWWLDGKAVIVRCNCGAALLLDHEIAADGTVTPSLWHSEVQGACGWHVVGRLDGWTPPASSPSQ